MREMLTYTLGAISPVTGMLMRVLPAWQATRRVPSIRPPFSTDTRASEPSDDGMVMPAVSPTEYFSLSVSMLSLVAPSDTPLAVRESLTSQSRVALCPPLGSLTLITYGPEGTDSGQS